MGRVAEEFSGERQQKVMSETSWSQEPEAGVKAPQGPEPLLEDKPGGFSVDPCFNHLSTHFALSRCSQNLWITS